MKYLTLIGIVSLALFSCKKDGCMDDTAYNFNHDAEKDNGSCLFEGNLEINITPKFDGQPISFDSVYQNISGYRIKFSSIKFYTTTGQATTTSGTVNEVNSVSKYDFATSNTLFNDQLKAGSYNNIGFNIGVDMDRNHADPAAFSADNPLNIINSSGMFWTWSSGYIFVVIEGQYDTDSTSTTIPTTNFSYHLGKDAFLKWNSNNVSFAITEKLTTQINYALNMETFFFNANDTLDIAANPIIHSLDTQLAITEMLSTNFNNSLVIE